MALHSEFLRHLMRRSSPYFQDYRTRLERQDVEDFFNPLLESCQTARTADSWGDLVRRWNAVKSHLDTHFELIQLAFQRFTNDAAVEAEERRLREEIEPIYTRLNAEVRRRLLSSDFRSELEARYGRQFFLQLQIQEDAFHPQNVDLETRLHQVLADYTKLTGSASFEVEGQRYPLAHIKKFSVSPREDLRRQSYTSYSGWFLSHRDELEAFFDQAETQRQQMAKNLGHADFIPLAYQKMRRVDYGPSEAAAFRRQIREVVVPIAVKLRAAQARALHKTRVSIWDLDYFPHWQVEGLKVEIEQQPEAALRIYRALSPRLAEHFRTMIEKELIDVPARSGKAPGAFCTAFDDYRVPFIFLNSVGEASDVTTLLHESGHAFQAWESRDIELQELTHPTLEACEVHSMGMEFLAFPYYGEFLAEADVARFRKLHVAESLCILPYIAMVDEFQHRIYSGEARGAKGREAAWRDLEAQYMPDVEFGPLQTWQGTRWLRQLHIFQVPFYYIDYAIAQVGAWQLWMQSRQNLSEAVENYLHLCRLGGTLPLKDFFAAGRLRLPFEDGMLKTLLDEVLKAEPLL